MYSLFKISLISSLRERSVILFLLLTAVAPFLLADITYHQLKPELLAPARGQAAWLVAWLLGSLWCLLQGAKLGANHSMSGMGSYYTSGGFSRGRQLTALWLSVALFAVVFALIPVLISFVFLMPDEAKSYSHVAVLTVQHFSYMLLVLLPLLWISISLASRFGVIVGSLVSIGIFGVGIYIVPLLGKVASVKDYFSFDALYVCLPHFYLGDLTHRFVHAQGALATKEFLLVFEYLSGWGLLFAGLGWVIFNAKQK